MTEKKILNIEKLGVLFGSESKLAQILLLSPSTFTRWKERRDGKIPLQYNSKIRLAARDFLIKNNASDKDSEMFMLQVMACLEADLTCPHCHKSLDGIEL